MIISVCYSLLAVGFIIGLTRLLLLLFFKVEAAKLSIVYISLFSKMIFLSVFTLAVKNELDNKIIYATIVLFGICIVPLTLY